MISTTVFRLINPWKQEDRTGSRGRLCSTLCSTDRTHDDAPKAAWLQAASGTAPGPARGGVPRVGFGWRGLFLVSLPQGVAGTPRCTSACRRHSRAMPNRPSTESGGRRPRSSRRWRSRWAMRSSGVAKVARTTSVAPAILRASSPRLRPSQVRVRLPLRSASWWRPRISTPRCSSLLSVGAGQPTTLEPATVLCGSAVLRRRSAPHRPASSVALPPSLEIW